MKWFYNKLNLGGNCPVQAEFRLFGYYFYFRARGNAARLEAAKSSLDWWNHKILYSRVIYTCKSPDAGWLSNRFCAFLILKGLVLFFIWKLYDTV